MNEDEIIKKVRERFPHAENDIIRLAVQETVKSRGKEPKSWVNGIDDIICTIDLIIDENAVDHMENEDNVRERSALRLIKDRLQEIRNG